MSRDSFLMLRRDEKRREERRGVFGANENWLARFVIFDLLFFFSFFFFLFARRRTCFGGYGLRFAVALSGGE